ncbi:unnamed protein product [Lactuca saligna]|uniref:Uncharacterized protein n=1 Tax=Lactuca saligna TaxID=75948 RepID=A0AA35UPI1_LACSI|nr:unnamed protein product [Lactuca saligna]
MRREIAQGHQCSAFLDFAWPRKPTTHYLWLWMKPWFLKSYITFFVQGLALEGLWELPKNTRLNEGITGGLDEENNNTADDYIDFEDEHIDKISV